MLRMSPEAFNEHQARIHAHGKSGRSNKAPIIEKPKKANKYHAEPTHINGIRFDSKDEAKRFLILLDEERRGRISALQHQVRFNLLPEQVVAGHREKPVDYIADFTYLRDGALVVEDVKSRPTRTREYILKRKLMLFVHGIHVEEVMMNAR